MRWALSVILLVSLSVPVAAQQAVGGQVASSVAGQAGQRQTRDQAAAAQGRAPLARIDTRLRNRVQSRIRNRIDRGYMSGASATDAFDAAAAEQTGRTGGQ